MRIATYNINSVRLRLNRLIQLLKKENIDILCLQETKCEDHLFPKAEIEKAGWHHIFANGEKSYNGVAIISRIPLQGVFSEYLVNDHKRHIAATLPNGTVLHNFYVPAGGDEPDPAINAKFRHKLDYMDEMAGYFSATSADKSQILVGDLNIAPLENDVWSHKQLLNVVSHTQPETTRLNRLQEGLAWIDTARHFVPEHEKLYSWWSYRNHDWRKSNRGRRLDHIWITPTLKSKLISCHILKDWRDGDKPSDHVPIVMDIAL